MVTMEDAQGETSVPSVNVRQFQFCTKGYRYHASIGPMFHLFHTGLARNRPLFAMLQHFTELGDTPFWHLRVPKGAEMTSLAHPYLQAFVVRYDRHLLYHQLVCHWTCERNQLNGLCHKKGFFHGMKHSNH